MNVIQPRCRTRFTAQDIDFILDVLQPRRSQSDCLTQLLADEDTRDLILDDQSIHHAILEQSGCLRVSLRLYFYILVRNVLQRAGLADREVADYVAELLTQYALAANLSCAFPNQRLPLEYMVDMLAALQSADETTAFHVRTHIGNQSLFLTGVFPDHIRHRANRRGAPNLRYYQELGRASFRLASDHRLAERYEVSNVLATLAEEFDLARRALNDLADRVLALNDGSNPDPPWSGPADINN
jgi:hypothetical protein